MASTPAAVVFNFSTLYPNPADIGLTRVTVIALCSVTTTILLFVCGMAFIYYYGYGTRHTLDARTSAVLIFLTVLVATVAGVSGTTSAMDVYRVYIFSICLLVGVIFTITGAYMFFDNKPMVYGSNAELKSKEIGHKHDNMGIIIWLVTLPLIAMEFAIVLGNLRRHKPIFYVGDYSVALVQKFLQATIYYFSLRHRYYCAKLPFTSHWYFVVLAIFNFILWEDSILTSREDDNYSKYLYGNGFSIFKATYNSLIIDYRLLCCLLFAEHAMEINRDIAQIKSITEEELVISSLREPLSEDFPEAHNPDRNGYRRAAPQAQQIIHFSSIYDVKVSHYTGAGYILGLLCLALQAVNGLQYLNFVGPWANVMAMAAHLFMFVLGVIFFRVNSFHSVLGKWKQTDTRAIDAMVGIMGGIGFVFMIIRALMTLNLATYYRHRIDNTYLAMSAGKNCLNGIGLLFQFYVFMRVPFNICSHVPNSKKLLNHFLVPALTIVQLSIFVTAIIDEYDGDVEKLLSLANLDPAIVFFLDVGSPVYLGFCLHMFLHFLIIRRNMTTKHARIAYLLEDSSIGSLDDVTPDAIDATREGPSLNREEPSRHLTHYDTSSSESS